ncbi:MAG: cell division protein FtsZ, partial [Rhodococcus sp. (in: high G+C Gram-positive bacteria)]
SALMGIGSSRGEGRAIKAAESAINSPLLEASMEGARGVLLSIAGGSDLGLFEINEAASLVQEAAHIDANIIFGTVIDDSLGDEVRVTVIAAGFDGGAPARRPVESGAAGRSAIGAGRAGEVGQSEQQGNEPMSVTRETISSHQSPSSLPPIPGNGQSRTVPVSDEEGEDEVDVPSFMRR